MTTTNQDFDPATANIDFSKDPEFARILGTLSLVFYISSACNEYVKALPSLTDHYNSFMSKLDFYPIAESVLKKALNIAANSTELADVNSSGGIDSAIEDILGIVKGATDKMDAYLATPLGAVSNAVVQQDIFLRMLVQQVLGDDGYSEPKYSTKNPNNISGVWTFKISGKEVVIEFAVNDNEDFYARRFIDGLPISHDIGGILDKGLFVLQDYCLSLFEEFLATKALTSQPDLPIHSKALALAKVLEDETLAGNVYVVAAADYINNKKMEYSKKGRDTERKAILSAIAATIRVEQLPQGACHDIFDIFCDKPYYS